MHPLGLFPANDWGKLQRMTDAILSQRISVQPELSQLALRHSGVTAGHLGATLCLFLEV